MAAVKAAALSLLLDAYQRRDKVGLITFRGTEATLALPPTSSIDTAAADWKICRVAAVRRWPRACSAPPKRYGWSASATRAAARCWCSSPTAGRPTVPTRSVGHGW